MNRKQRRDAQVIRQARKQAPERWRQMQIRLQCGNDGCDGYVNGVEVLCDTCEQRFMDSLRAAGLRPELAN